MVCDWAIYSLSRIRVGIACRLLMGINQHLHPNPTEWITIFSMQHYKVKETTTTSNWMKRSPIMHVFEKIPARFVIAWNVIMIIMLIFCSESFSFFFRLLMSIRTMNGNGGRGIAREKCHGCGYNRERNQATTRTYTRTWTNRIVMSSQMGRPPNLNYNIRAVPFPSESDKPTTSDKQRTTTKKELPK